MRVDEVLRVCPLMVPAVVRWLLRDHLRETARGRQQAVPMQTEVLALRAGATVVGVMDRRHGPAILLVHAATEGSNNASQRQSPAPDLAPAQRHAC